MATTNYAMTLLEVGQKEKEVTINTNFTILDNVPKYLGDLAAAPTVLTTIPLGSTYFNTVTNKVQILRNKTGPVWSNIA
jgi:hypothetical protein